MEQSQLVKRAIELVGSQASLASKCGVSQAAVSKWAREVCKVGPIYSVKIEEATKGEISRYLLRPDVFGAPPGQLSLSLPSISGSST
ncbi:helix-turn-helix domain-containing protein [Oceanospirillum beijerinckii]|uniref:helix-turn-helix domain-containing protein n=1 Tax=Oceanospirillum beijerinckii TaxID=64976 RepID=UPI000A03523C